PRPRPGPGRAGPGQAEGLAGRPGVIASFLFLLLGPIRVAILKEEGPRVQSGIRTRPRSVARPARIVIRLPSLLGRGPSPTSQPACSCQAITRTLPAGAFRISNVPSTSVTAK